MGSKFGNPFGFGPDETDAERRVRTSRESIRKGRAAEEIIRNRYAIRGYEINRTGRGSDYEATKRDIMGKIIDRRLIEVKFGDAPVSDLQIETMKSHKGHYTIERVTLPPIFWKEL